LFENASADKAKSVGNIGSTRETLPKFQQITVLKASAARKTSYGALTFGLMALNLFQE
jgi:hypothetical protein